MGVSPDSRRRFSVHYLAELQPSLIGGQPLLLYIDVRHANLVPPSLTVGEARDISPRYTTANDLAPVQDALADLVSQSRRAHVLVKEPEALVQVAELVPIELVNSSDAEATQGEEMVKRRTMTIDRFLLGIRPMA